MFPPALPLALLATTALAEPPAPTAHVYGLDIYPETQRLVATMDVVLPFPVGTRRVEASLSCRGGGTATAEAVVPAGLDHFTRDAEGTAALSTTGVTTVAPRSLKIRSRTGPLVFACQGDVLQVDFSALAADPSLQADIADLHDTFGIEQQPQLGTVTIRYPIVTRDVGGLVQPEGVTLYLSSSRGLTAAGRKTLRGVSIGPVAGGTYEALFLQDAAGRSLTALKFGGDDSGARTAVGAPVGTQLVLYYAPDFRSPTGWRRTTIDFARATISTVTVTKPAIPVAR